MDIPRKIDYSMCILVRNLLIWMLFRCSHPEEITIDLIELLKTKDCFGYLSTYVCPCGATYQNFHL